MERRRAVVASARAVGKVARGMGRPRVWRAVRFVSYWLCKV